jgi:hypothetical protein
MNNFHEKAIANQVLVLIVGFDLTINVGCHMFTDSFSHKSGGSDQGLHKLGANPGSRRPEMWPLFLIEVFLIFTFTGNCNEPKCFWPHFNEKFLVSAEACGRSRRFELYTKIKIKHCVKQKRDDETS